MIFVKVGKFTLNRLEKYEMGITLSYFLEWISILKIDKLYKSTSVKDYLHKIIGVDQGNAQQLNKTTTFASVFSELSRFVLFIKYLIFIKNDSCF